MRKKYLTNLILVIFSSLSYGVSSPTASFSDNHTTSLTLLNNTMPSYSNPSCSTQDYYWNEKLGIDFVTLPQINTRDAVIDADSIMGQQDGAHYANGNVIGYKDDKTIVADWLFYDQKTAHATGGNVILSRQYDVIQGKWVDYYLDLDRGVVVKATMTNSQTDMFASGERINIIDKNKYQVQKGYFTTCDPKAPQWSIRADSADFNYQDSQGTARNAIFYLQSMPVVSIPYFIFPLGQRKSGVLPPIFGQQTNVGKFFGLPYYWNMAPNYDMTITPKFYTTALDMGNSSNLNQLMLTDQFRYLNKTGSGEIYTEQLAPQINPSQYRYYWSGFDTHYIATPDLTLGYKYKQVSDSNYFVDFGDFYSGASSLNLEQSVSLSYAPKWYTMGVLVRKYQTLQPTGNPSISIYQTEPQLTFNINPLPLGENGLRTSLISQYTKFSINNQAGQTGARAVFYPSVDYPYQNQWSFITPKLGYNYTNYELDPFSNTQSLGGTINRGLPIASLDSGLIFDRPVTLLKNSYVQTLEPRLYYLYIPAINQGNIPVFDTAQATANINELFSENRFSGFDRINAANDITVGLNSKLINDTNGVEFANWGVAYRYYLDKNNDLIYGNPNQFQQIYLPQPNLITELNNKWQDTISTGASFQYSTVYNEVDAYNVQIQYKDEKARVLNLRFGYQYKLPLIYYTPIVGQVASVEYENQYAIDLSGQIPIFSNKWLLDGRLNYDFTQQKLLNALTGIEYNGGCWSVRGLFQTFIGTNTVSSVNPIYINAWFLEFNLKGLTSIGYGGDPNSILNQNIPGYIPVKNIY